MLFAAIWMDLEITLVKVNQTQKDKYMLSFMCVILKSDTVSNLGCYSVWSMKSFQNNYCFHREKEEIFFF